ncbi:sperm flagellar protein 1-like isoform X5 [Crassostrea angulata]|uniref:sperm flagellar protein 1-like isoform X5 n=1 Tax=Magallana angulata TaxID=2784310 RepID=UPI0022B1B203|nr:sperm flagellar protein 1-like isoform X5 [Crassostrea angulata]
MSVQKLQSTDSGLDDFDDAELEQLYTWIDSIPLSRPKKNIARDFSDGVLVSEIMHHKFPHLVQKHNYSVANSTSKKMENWYYLNRKVFKKLNFELSEELIRDLVNAKPGTIELLLQMLKMKIERAEWEMRSRKNPPPKAQRGRRNDSDQPEADQNMGSPGRHKKGTSPTRAGGHEYYTNQPRQKILRNVSEADHVPRLVFEEKVQECLAKDETIKILQAKIHRLEHLIHLKDVRIDDLQGRVESMRPTGQFRR